MLYKIAVNVLNSVKKFTLFLIQIWNTQESENGYSNTWQWDFIDNCKEERKIIKMWANMLTKKQLCSFTRI